MSVDETLMLKPHELFLDPLDPGFIDAVERGVRLIVMASTWKKWERRVRHLEQLIAEHPSTRKLLLERHFLELQTLPTYRHIMLTGRLPRPNLLQTWCFVSWAQLAHLYARLPEAARTRLAGTIRGSLESQRGFRPLLWEVNIAYALAMQGFGVSFVDLCGAGRYDYLAESAEVSMEVECKHVTGGKGLNRDEFAQQLLDHAIERHQEVVCSTGGVWLIKIESCSSVPRDRTTLDRLAKTILRSIGQAGCHEEAGVRFSCERICDWDGTVEHVHRLAPEIASKLPSPFLTAFGSPKSPFILAHGVSETEAKRFLVVWERFLKSSARQFTGSRPAALFIEFERATRIWGTDTQRQRALEERAASLAVMHEAVEGLGKERSYLLGISVSFGGLPFTGGDTFTIKNPNSAVDPGILELFTKGSEQPKFMSVARDAWDSQWFEF